jgi:hypothetical protein
VGNPTQINQGGAGNQERQPEEQTGQGVVRDERGQEQPADKRKAQKSSYEGGRANPIPRSAQLPATRLRSAATKCKDRKRPRVTAGSAG